MNPDAVQRFREITGADEQTANRCLIAREGNVEAAVNLYLNEAATRAPDVQGGNNPRGQPGQDRSALANITNFFGSAILFPFRYIRTIAEETTRDPNEELLTGNFVRSYEFKYGGRHPNFVEAKLQDAMQLATNQSKFVFVYLHSPEHEDTDAFCQDTLSSSELVAFLNRNFICWGGDIQKTPAFSMALEFGAKTYPFMCVLGTVGTQMQDFVTVQGKVTPVELVAALQRCLDDQGSLLLAQRVERRQREADRQLRMDQDLEYQRALEIDRERDRRNREAEAARAAVEEEKRRQAEQERLKKEAEERRKMEREEAIISRRSQKQMSLKPEPQEQPIVIFRVRLPDGSAHTRKFSETDKVQDVYNYVDSLEGLRCWDYTLASSFPKTELSNDSRDKTLKEMGLEHSATLLVQSHDD